MRKMSYRIQQATGEIDSPLKRRVWDLDESAVVMDDERSRTVSEAIELG